MANRREIAEKLRQYLETKDIKQKDIAEKMGTTAQYINGIINGRNVIGKGLADKLEKYYGLSSAFLLTGKGSLLVDDENDDAENLQQQNMIPLIPTEAIGGALTGNDGQWMDYECEKFVIPAFRNSDFMIRVDGDSMEPKYCRGDIVACKKVPLNDIWFQWGKVYVISTTQGVLIKHIEPGESDEYITLVSDNKNYRPFQLHKSYLNGIAIVNGLIRVE